MHFRGNYLSSKNKLSTLKTLCNVKQDVKTKIKSRYTWYDFYCFQSNFLEGQFNLKRFWHTSLIFSLAEVEKQTRKWKQGKGELDNDLWLTILIAIFFKSVKEVLQSFNRRSIMTKNCPIRLFLFLISCLKHNFTQICFWLTLFFLLDLFCFLKFLQKNFYQYCLQKLCILRPKTFPWHHTEFV